MLPYFPLNQVQDGLFRLATTLFGIRIEEQPLEVNQGWDGWHQDVKFFHVYNNNDENDQDNKHIASFYLDPFSRPSEKRGGKLFFKSERERALRNGINCSYCYSSFLLVDSSFNALYGVIPFKQAQTVYTKNSI